MRAAPAWIALCLLLFGATAQAESLEDITGTTAQEEMARSSLRALDQAVQDGEDDALLDARARLVLIGDVGLKHVGARLAAGEISDLYLPHLLHVVATSEHPAADALLIEAAQADRAEIRMRAADGLGRGRTEAAVPALATLARDPVPGVRAAALRSLFALESDAAVTTRQTLPADARSDLNARRLRWHRIRGRATEAVRDLALAAWKGGRSPEERLAAARLLASPKVAAPLPVLTSIVTELGTDALGAGLSRVAHDVPQHGYDLLAARQAAILAAWMVSYHPDTDATLRAQMVDREVGWLARPVTVNPLDERPIPANLLRMFLPDFGAEVVEPTVKRLRARRFWDPQDGVALLVEALDGKEAATVLRSLVDPKAEPPVSLPVRVAAAGGLSTLGRIDDESFARLLVAETEDPAIRRDALTAIGRDPGEWAVPLLGEVASRNDPALSPAAVQALERRTDDDRARALLVEHLFERAGDPGARIRVLVEPGDEVAYALLERAFAHPRGSIRRAALQMLHKVPALENDRARTLLRNYTVKAKGPRERTHELQQVLYAYFALLPTESVPWIQAKWAEFEALGWAPVAIRSLQNLKHPDAQAAVVDFVLGIADATEDVGLLQEAATALDDRSGHRDADLDAFWRRLLTHADEELVTWALLSLEHPGRGDLTPELLALLADLDRGSEDDYITAAAILDVFEHQRWAAIETPLVDLLLDAYTLDALRHRIGSLFVGRVSDPARASLQAWLLDPENATADPLVLRLAARVVGEGQGAEVAAPVLAALEARLDALYEEGRFEDPLKEREAEPVYDLPALAHAVAHTGDHAALTRLLALTFDDRLARYARRATEGQARRLGPTDASGAGQLTPKLYALWLRVKGGFSPMPDEIYRVLERVKPAGDVALAAAAREVLERAHESGRLAAFPDAYLDRVIAPLANPESGNLTETTGVVGTYVERAEPVGGAVDFFAARARVERLIRERRFADAVEAQRLVVRMLARRAYDDERGWPWRRERAHLQALEGATLCQAGDLEAAETAFQEAVARHPLDSGVLQQTARLRALTKCGLDTALALARRARVLEWRVFNEMGIATGDTLALVLLQLDRPEEATRAMMEILPRVKPEPHLGGRYHVRLAQARCAAGDLEGAAAVVLQALGREPTLARELGDDPWLAPLRANGRLAALAAQAEAEALTNLIR